MPCLYNLDQVGANLITDGREFARGTTVIGAQFDGLQPKFADHMLSLNVHMHGLVAVKAVKEKSVWARDTYYARHIRSFDLFWFELPLSPDRIAQTTGRDLEAAANGGNEESCR